MIRFPNFVRIISLCGFLLVSGSAFAACTVSANPLSLGQITLGAAVRGVLTTTASCAPDAVTGANTPYSYSFVSGNGGPGSVGRLSGVNCSLVYSIVSYATNGAYGITDYFISPPAVGSIIGNGANQVNNFGVVIAAAQSGCALAPNTPLFTVTDNLLVSVNY